VREASGTTLLTNPNAKASWALIVSPARISSIAFFRPIIFDTSYIDFARGV
jgi:hypothetical protein